MSLCKIPELPASVPLETPRASFLSSLQISICRYPKKLSSGSEGLPGEPCLGVFSYWRAVPGHGVDAVVPPLCHLFTLLRFGKSTLDTTTPHCPTSTPRAEHIESNAEALAAAVLNLHYRTMAWLSSQKG